MAKILLLDFTPADRDRLVSEKYDVDVRATGWTTGRDEPLDLPGDSEVVFYQIGGEAAAVRPDLHAEVQEALTERVRAGARVVCFIGGGDAARLTNIVGPMDGIQVQDSARTDAVVFNPRALYLVPFERFKPFIAKAFRLLPETFGDGVWEKEILRERQVRVPGQDHRRRPRGHDGPQGQGLLPAPALVRAEEYRDRRPSSSRTRCRSRPSSPRSRPATGSTATITSSPSSRPWWPGARTRRGSSKRSWPTTTARSRT